MCIQAGIKGTLNILVQGEKAGITKFSLVSSIIAAAQLPALGNGPLVTDKGETQLLRHVLMEVDSSRLQTGTLLPWNKAWILAQTGSLFTRQKRPSLNEPHGILLTSIRMLRSQPVRGLIIHMTSSNCYSRTVNPPFFLGPMAPEWNASEPSISTLSTNYILYDLLRRNGPLRPHPSSVDVRDVARALVLSLTAPPTAQVGHKRILMSGEWFVPAEAVAYVAEARPELKGRLSEAWKKEVTTPTNNIDNSRAKEVLGLELTDWRKTVLDGVDSLIALETKWKNQGWVPPQ